MQRAKSRNRIVMQFCTGLYPGRSHPCQFFSPRFRHFRMAGVKFQVFPLTFNVVLITLWHCHAHRHMNINGLWPFGSCVKKEADCASEVNSDDHPWWRWTVVDCILAPRFAHDHADCCCMLWWKWKTRLSCSRSRTNHLLMYIWLHFDPTTLILTLDLDVLKYLCTKDAVSLSRHSNVRAQSGHTGTLLIPWPWPDDLDTWLDLDIQKGTSVPKMKFPGQCFQKLEPEDNRHIQMRPTALLRRVSGL